MRYVDCRTCGGRQVPETILVDRVILFGDRKGQPIQVSETRCSGCQGFDIRHVSIRVKANGNRGKCGGACLNGKTNCDCRCNGRCHGAGVCSCGQVAA
jgi:hypothetical protein